MNKEKKMLIGRATEAQPSGSPGGLASARAAPAHSVQARYKW
jgi:hypothetical protein